MNPIEVKMFDLENIEKRRWVNLSSVLPYGVWSCADGREVIFNRQYHPMYEREINGKWARADPGEWVHWTKQTFLYDDSVRLHKRMQLAAALLKEWGIG